MTDFLMGAVSIFGGVAGASIGFAVILLVFAVLLLPYLHAITRRPTTGDHAGYLERSTDDQILGQLRDQKRDQMLGRELRAEPTHVEV